MGNDKSILVNESSRSFAEKVFHALHAFAFAVQAMRFTGSGPYKTTHAVVRIDQVGLLVHSYC